MYTDYTYIYIWENLKLTSIGFDNIDNHTSMVKKENNSTWEITECKD